MTNTQNKNESTLNSVKEKTSEGMSQMSDEVRRQAGKSVSQVQEQTMDMVSSRKEQAAEQIDGIARALRQTSRNLHDEHNDTVAQYADSLADGVERVSRYLHDNDVNQFLSDAERLAHRQPELFLGGAFTLGLLAARFFRSSGSRRQGHFSNQSYSRQGMNNQNFRQREWDGDWQRNSMGGTDYGNYGQAGPNRYDRDSYSRGRSEFANEGSRTTAYPSNTGVTPGTSGASSISGEVTNANWRTDTGSDTHKHDNSSATNSKREG